MKRLGFLLPVYMLILACMPCADVDDCISPDQLVITASSSQKQEKGAETCSPFCTCNCCGQRVPSQKVFTISSSVVILPVKQIASFQSFALQSVLQQIWQPPQLV